jgi:hypothetical protein
MNGRVKMKYMNIKGQTIKIRIGNDGRDYGKASRSMRKRTKAGIV